uniref:RNI-like superfamily protein n=1 Tax=Gongylonema pulchrum TaxID=637853 RepID=A0A183ENU5_9BILA
LEVLNLSLCELHNISDIVHWALAHCPNMQFLDLTAVALVDSSVIEICLKEKADKAPITTFALADCRDLEGEAERVSEIFGIMLAANSTARFQLSRRFRSEIQQCLPDGFKFCLK